MMTRIRPQSMRFATRREAGFTLMEVLAALTIFAMGVVSVISLFPITARIQSETIGDVMSQIVMRNAEVTLRTRPIPVWYLNNGGAPSTITGIVIALNTPSPPITADYSNFGTYSASTATDVMELPKTNGGFLGWLDDVKGIYTLRDRSYPAVSAVGSHAYTWVPLVRRKRTPGTPPGATTALLPGELLPEDWDVFVFVHRNESVGYINAVAGSNKLKEQSSLPFPNFVAGGIGMKIVVKGAGPGGADLITTVTGATFTSATNDEITIADNASTSSVGTRVYAPGQILNAAIKTTSDLTRFDFDGFKNDPAAPDIVPGQQVLMNDGTIYNVTRADSTGFHISGLVLPDSAGKYPNRVWFSAKGTVQLFRIEGAEVIK